MIPKETIDKIFESADIIEVIGQFVSLKKSGSNYKGLSPFVNEKTPSFMVSPAKRIFKDFSSGKGGNVVTFLMEHEHFTYPEALKWLANKYQIEVQEKEQTPEDIALNNEKDKLFIIHKYANTFFHNQLKDTQEGKSIGLSYFKQRGYDLTTIDKFQLGYSPENPKAFSEAALKDGHKLDLIIKSGLVKTNEKGNYDFFRARVIFPIQNLTGRVIGFGGRTLRTDKKTAKYFNSPESEIYKKSYVLYGLYQAKNAIIKQDNCYLVEGYTDVISLNQAGIENVVSSSGTSLTEGQIRLIKRFTKNVTILYDGDSAGIKASFRGIDLILKEGLNVQVVLFPEGEDPDSFSQKESNSIFRNYLQENKKGFIKFKSEILLSETKNDPIKKAETIKDIVQSISAIPDQITRTVFLKETSDQFDMDEQVLLNELNKILRQNTYGKATQYKPNINQPKVVDVQKSKKKTFNQLEFQERDLIRLMLMYGDLGIPLNIENEEGELVEQHYPLAQFVIEEMVSDKLSYVNEDYQKIYNEFLDALENDLILNDQHFINNPDQNINSIVVDLTTSRDHLSENWIKKHNIHTKTEGNQLKKAVVESVTIFKLRVTENLISNKQDQLKSEEKENELINILKDIKQLTNVRNIFANELGIIITK
ncbi:MAG: DNA primase [Crocinitomicaceae bacterium]|nr:DNA primase [Crocinitomicaceae bacterium]